MRRLQHGAGPPQEGRGRRCCPTASSRGCSSPPTGSSSPASGRRRSEFRPLTRGWSTSRPRDATATAGRPSRSETCRRDRPPWSPRASRRRSRPDRRRTAARSRPRQLVARDATRGRAKPQAAIVADRAPARATPGRDDRARSRPRRPVAELEPFRSMPRNPPAPAAGEPRRLYVCPDHAELDRPSSRAAARWTGRSASCVVLGDSSGVRWWCPMHPNVTADRARAVVPRVRRDDAGAARHHLAPAGPGARRAAVGRRRHGRRGRSSSSSGMPGMFDGVEVVLGPALRRRLSGGPGPRARPAGRDRRGLPARRRDPAQPEPGRRLLRGGEGRPTAAAARCGTVAARSIPPRRRSAADSRTPTARWPGAEDSAR